jgi:HEAT repeats
MMAHPQRSIATFLAVAFLSSTFALATVGEGWGKSASNPQISTYIKQLKTNRDWRKRSQAASALGGMSQEAETVVPALIEALQDTDEVVRLRATFALAKFGSQAVPELIEALKAENEAARTSAAFALRYMGFSVAPMLADALKSGDMRVRSLALSTLKQMATDLQRRPLSQSPSIAELQQAVSALEAAQQEMERFLKLRNPTVGLANSTALREAGYASEDEQTIRQSLITFRRNIQDYYTGIARTVALRVLGILVLVGAFILWSRPELLLRFSRQRKPSSFGAGARGSSAIPEAGRGNNPTRRATRSAIDFSTG